ncbi:MAG TPA: hypothetical protein VHO90_13835 [Bacteroidales bacterium]|nr:hypothetical protein [Bacteroidales bacterium]
MGPYKIFLIVFLLFGSICIFSQEPSYNFRSLNLNIGDSIIKTQICNEVVLKKHFPNAFYYWYYSGKINMNQGGYSGKLIHGKYEVFNKSNKLICSGNFNYGLKEGEWKEWYPGGNIKTLTKFHNGMIHGEYFSYDEKGKLISKETYNEGMLDGRSYFYLNDTVVIKKFKDGKEITKPSREKEKDLSAKPKSRVKKETKHKDKGNQEVENSSVKPKPSFRLFKKSSVKRTETEGVSEVEKDHQ